jgi:hypothetical protein
MTEKFPAPWTLHGSGYIMVYRFPKCLRGSNFFAPDSMPREDFTGFGTVMLANYTESTAGPYGELLFIPGRFRYGRKKYYCITKIYVSTMVSVENGRDNWGIPKELADFSFTRLDEKRELVSISKNGTPIVEMVIRKRGIPYPLSTRLFPVPLVQHLAGKTYFTRFRGMGKSRLGVIESICVNPGLFPDISAHRPLFVKCVQNFTIEFPPAEIQ